MGKATGNALSDRKSGEEIMRELEVAQITDLGEHKRNWKGHVDKLTSHGILNKM
jgi:hypothetical protein